jgi:branched-chain amino acid transport system permease protein
MASETPLVESQASRSLLQRWLENRLRDRLLLGLQIAAILLIAYLAWTAGTNIANGEYTAERFLNQLITGTAQGSIYALIALGYTLVYGILFMINFAHGEVFMAGAYAGFFVIYSFDQLGFLENATSLAILITVLAGTLGSVIIAFLLERIAYRPLRSAPRLVPLITAIGASITLQQLFMRLFGASTRSYPVINLYVPWLFPNAECEEIDGAEICRGVDLINGRYTLEYFNGDLELRLRPIYLFVFLAAILLMVALWLFIKQTKTGRAMRAVSENKEAAALMGVNVDRVIVVTFILGAALAGAGAVLFALYNRQVGPFMGFTPGIKAFTAAVLGGIGNVPGAMFGGLVLGIVESVAPALLGWSNQIKDVISFIVLVMILIFRPTGIFGEAVTEKKA